VSRDPTCGEEGRTGQLGEETHGAAQQECPDRMGVIGPVENTGIQ